MDVNSLESRFSSIVPRIEFINVQDQYSYNQDLVCRYTLIDYEAQEGDRIAIFKLGWQYVKDYVLFEWIGRDEEENCVTFNKLSLPKSTIEIYQFCFISGENSVHGASEPFQFCDRPKNFQSLFTMSMHKKDGSLPENYKPIMNDSSVFCSFTDMIVKDKDILQLKEENDLLRNTLKTIVTQSNSRNYDNDIMHLKKITQDLQTIVSIQQSQINDLQAQVRASGALCEKFKKAEADLRTKFDECKKQLESNPKNISPTKIDFEIGELESIPPFPFAK